MAHRFYISDTPLTGEKHIESLQIAHQLSRVLRVKPGETVTFFNGDGYDVSAEILFYTERGVRIRVLSREKHMQELPVPVSLYMSLIKKDLFERVIQQATEIGVSRFVPIITRRTLVKDISVERLDKIIKEAAEQSGRAVLPALEEPVPLAAAFDRGATEGAALVCHAGEEHQTTLEALGRQIGARRVSVFIGPEGGFTGEEIGEAARTGCAVVRLFPTVLRAETAAVVFSAFAAAAVCGAPRDI